MSTSMDIECPECRALNSVEVDSVDELANLECEECGSPLFDEEDDEDNTEFEDARPVVSRGQPSLSAASAPGYQEPDRYQPAQGQSRLGRDIQQGDYVDIRQSARKEGLYIIGTPGTGKSGLIENLIIQDMKQGYGVGLLDPHGDLTQAVLSRLPENREQDVIYLDIADEDYPFGLNLFECSNPKSTKAVQIVVDQVMHIFEKLFEVSRQTPRMAQYLRNCTHTLVANPGSTMAEIPLLLEDEQCRRKLVANLTNPQVRLFWHQYERMRPQERYEEARSTLNKLDEFLQGLTFNIVAQSKTTISFRDVMDKGKILLVKLDATLPSVTSLIGSIIIALFLNAAYSRTDLPLQKRRQFNLYADEFHRFATEDFALLLTEARKFGIATTIAHQARYQPGMNDGIRATSLSAKNKVVFKVNSIDADELAGEFDVTPQEAWEQEIEPERIKVLRPQRHEKKVEQVEVEVEEEIQEISQSPVDHLVRGSHGNVSVRKVTQAMLAPLVEAVEMRKPTSKFVEIFPSPFNERKIIPYQCSCYRHHEVQEGKTLINRLLVDVMEKRVAVEYSSELTARIQKIVLTLSGFIGWFGVYESVRSKYDAPYEKHHETDAALLAALSTLIQSIVNNNNVAPSYSAFCFELKRRVSEVYKPEQREYEWQRTQDKNSISEWADQAAGCARDFISNLVILCKGLATDPILVGTGQKRMVKRIQPHITYLTHESEKITIPRKTIMHPQRTYADMHNEVASQLTNLDNFMTKARYINSGERLVECTMRMLDPGQSPDKQLFGQALQGRLDSIIKQNIQFGYLRERAKVEEEIINRQMHCSEPQSKEPPDEPPISRHPQR